MSARSYSRFDQVIIQVDQLLRNVLGNTSITSRPSPAKGLAEPVLSQTERQHAAGLMRVNHAGEVSAQALYQGQALFGRDPAVKATMRRSAEEEIDHLDWCNQRLNELGSHTSVLNPLWYLGSFSLGSVAGLAGDKWSLGFVAETERQVVEHLQGHLGILPAADGKSRAIIEQMIKDEAAHGASAMACGGVELPALIKTAMRFCSRIMTRTAYHI